MTYLGPGLGVTVQRVIRSISFHDTNDAGRTAPRWDSTRPALDTTSASARRRRNGNDDRSHDEAADEADGDRPHSRIECEEHPADILIKTARNDEERETDEHCTGCER